MAFGLDPLVRGTRIKDKAAIAAFLSSLVFSAGLFGMTLGALGRPLATRVAVGPILAALALMMALLELRILPFSAPYRHWQVPRDWPRRYGLLPGYMLWGATLGLGVLSYVPFASYHVLLVWMLLSGGPTAGLMIGAAYGVGRAFASLVPGVIAARKPDQSMTTATAALVHQELYRGIQIAVLLTTAVSLAFASMQG